jgi:hypothetical protein
MHEEIYNRSTSAGVRVLREVYATADEALADLGLFSGAHQSCMVLRIAQEDPRMKDYIVMEQGLPEAIYSSIVRLGSDARISKGMHGMDLGPLEMPQSLHALTLEALRVSRMVVEWYMDVTKAGSCRAPLPHKRFLGGISMGSVGGEDPERSTAYDVEAEATFYDLLETPDSIRNFHLAHM